MFACLQSFFPAAADSGSVLTFECPSLEKILKAIETRNMVGTHDHALYLKAQVDNLTGHNEELRKELREVRFEATKARVAEDKAKSKVRARP